MLLGYPSPILQPDSGITWTGPAVTSLAGLRDGRAGALTILAWGSGSSEQLRASFPAPIRPRVAGLVNLLGLPAGLPVTVSLKRVGEGYDYQPREVTTHLTASGEVGVVAYWPAGLDLVEGVQFEIQDPGADLEEDQEFGCGEVVLADAGDFGMDATWSSGVADTAGDNMSKNGQLYLQPVPSIRTLSVSIPPTVFERAILDPDSVQRLRLALANDPRCLVVPDHASQARAEATWLYGKVARFDDLRFASSSRRATMQIRVDEMVGRPV